MTCQDISFNILGESPKFFKMIIRDIIQAGRLAIPEKFVKKYGDCLSSEVIIKVADGTLWKMELSKGEKYEAWLEKGWKEFLQHYSLKHGYLLLFKYEHNSNFLVFIFDDTTLLEIQYPRKPNFNPNGEILEFEGISHESKGRRNFQALEVADKFTSINPCFKVVLKPYCKGERSVMAPNVPIGFIREHMDSNVRTISLKIEGGICCWPTKLDVYWKTSFARLSTGWPAFVRDNCLKIKDVCVFELVAKNEFKVHMFSA